MDARSREDLDRQAIARSAVNPVTRPFQMAGCSMRFHRYAGWNLPAALKVANRADGPEHYRIDRELHACCSNAHFNSPQGAPLDVYAADRSRWGGDFPHHGSRSSPEPHGYAAVAGRKGNQQARV